MAAHTAGIGFSDRASVSNVVHNHIGHFAAAGAALAKSLFLGGVTRRFPQLRLALLEGRGRSRSADVLQPRGLLAQPTWPCHCQPQSREHRQGAHGHAGSAERWPAGSLCSHIRQQFCTNFYWGCESDDPLVGLGYDSRITPLGAKVPAIFASDLGHWDVPDFDSPLEEAYELIEHGILDAESFREFVFTNPLRFYGSLNPDFFTGTAIEEEAAAAVLQ